MLKIGVFIALASISTLLFYSLYFHPITSLSSTSIFYPVSSSHRPQCHSEIATGQVTFAGARYVKPRELIDKYKDLGEGSWNASIPKIIHQSWKVEQLPNKFLTWSNSWRLKHPDWIWVLWTNEDNDNYVSEFWPMLNETYWSLSGDIYRADLVRNLYLWHFGGVYADLDMECLRSFTSLFDSCMSSLLLSQPPSSPPSLIYQLALVGSMRTVSENVDNSIPNAFMASTPHHPLWLAPISIAMSKLGADETGHVQEGHGGGAWGWLKEITGSNDPEWVTGPVALRNGVLRYQRWENDLEKSRRGSNNAQSAPVMEHHRALSDVYEISTRPHARHSVVVLEPDVIYPFSWDWGIWDDKEGMKVNDPVYQKCRASSQNAGVKGFDAIGCQDALNVWDNGARAITYWSHSWTNKGSDDNTLDVLDG